MTCVQLTPGRYMTVMSVICCQRHDIMSLIVFMTLDMDVFDIGQTFDIGFLTLISLILALTLSFGNLFPRLPGFGPVWGLARPDWAQKSKSINCFLDIRHTGFRHRVTWHRGDTDIGYRCAIVIVCLSKTTNQWHRCQKKAAHAWTHVICLAVVSNHSSQLPPPRV